MTYSRWGFQIGKLSVCWWDAWGKRLGLEVAWLDKCGRGYHKILIDTFTQTPKEGK